MVMLKYLNELSFYYFAAQTEELAQVWKRLYFYVPVYHIVRTVGHNVTFPSFDMAL